MSNVNPSWWVFATLQRAAEPQSVDPALARDEALAVVLDEIASDPARDSDLVCKRFDSLCRNRLAKHKNRRAIVREHFRGTQ